MSQIFLSYRRDDAAGTTGRIYDRLKQRFGDKAIFRDLDSIQPGVDYMNRIINAIDQAAVQLVLIGPHWLNITDQAGNRRLDIPDDVVRMEISRALLRGIPVIPICIDNTPFPLADQLPPDLQKLARQNGLAVHNDQYFDPDMGRVITTVLECISHQPPSPPGLPARLAQFGFALQHVKHADVIIPPTCDVSSGPFLMGYANREGESPEHVVNVRNFGIGTYPVTVAEYACFVRTGYHAPLENEVTWQDQLERLDHPVVNVTWHDAVSYAAWLAKLTGQNWRLPTEAEWEKAAKWDTHANEGRLFPWGASFDPGRCNTRESGTRTTTAIGNFSTKDAAPCGTYDMAGNVWEWTSSLYRPYKYALNDGREKMDDSGPRVRRGGSWDSVASNARTSKRAWDRPESWNAYAGFRLAVGPGLRG